MSKRNHDALSDALIRKAEQKPNPYKLYDGGGLYLVVTANGSKLWRMDYRFLGHWKTLSFGPYPTTTLEEARSKRDEARRIRAAGRDPAAEKRALKAVAASGGRTFEAVAREWLALNGCVWTPRHGATVIRWLEADVFPSLGLRPIGRLTTQEIFAVCCRRETRTVYAVHRLLRHIGAIFRYAVATRQVTGNPVDEWCGALASLWPERREVAAAPGSIGAFLQAAERYSGDQVVRAVLRLAPLVILSPYVLRHLEWHEIDVGSAEIRISAREGQRGGTHIVPLSRQAMAILQEIGPLTGAWKNVFHSSLGEGGAVQAKAVRSALLQMGYKGEELAIHAFRRLGGSFWKEKGYRASAIGVQLADGECRRRASAQPDRHLPFRRRMMQDWADYLDELRGDK